MKRKVSQENLHQNWVHSHEEDTDTEMVFRPATFKFPRSRGRKSFELKPDGGLVETRIGPTDRPEKIQGTWKLEGDDNLSFYASHRAEPRRVMRIASLGKDRLALKK